MEFKKLKRNAELFLSNEWRLASVDEVKRNLETIKQKQILESWDIARLLDGWVDGPGYRYNYKNEYRPDMGQMLLVKSPVSRPSDGKFCEEMYSGVELNSEGLKAALLLSCDDKITEVVCFVLKTIIDRFQDKGERQKELDRLSDSVKETFSHRRTVLHYATDQPYNAEHAEYVTELVLRNFEYGKELIKAGDKYGRTALHFVALHGHINLCTFLVSECGLKAEGKDRNGENILHFVINSDNIDGVVRLLEMKEVKSLIASQDAKGKTPLHKAAANGNTRIISFLIRQLERSSEEYVRRVDLFGQTALHEAASGGHQKAVQYLLKKGSRPLLERNSEGKTALHYSVQISDQQRAKEMAWILLQHYNSSEEKSLLLWASAAGVGTAEESAESPEVERFLKQKRQNISRPGRSNNLLLSAVTLGYDKLAWELISRGANASQLDNFSNCELSQAHKERVQKYDGGENEDIDGDGQKRRAVCSWGWLPEHSGPPLPFATIVSGACRGYSGVCSAFGDLTMEALSHAGAFLKRVEKMPEGGRDQPTIYDSLGRKAFAEGLAALFLNPYVKSPVTVGISGDWGMGKSSLMLQTEMILLQAAAQLAFPNILPFEDFPGSKQFELTPKGREIYKNVTHGVKDILPASEIAHIDDPLVYFLNNYQDKYSQVYKSLALMDRREMDKTSDSSSSVGKIPTVMTVRYNAWHYQNELEALAGLAVTITKAMEETMTKSQRIRSKRRELQDLKYGSIPVTVVVLFWTVTKQLYSVFKPVSVQILGYIRLPDHSTNLGYQHQLISDINFLKNQIREKPSLFWKFVAGNWLWRMFGLYRDTVEGTSIPKRRSPSKDDARIIVFVDDLDRCQHTVILQVLSAVNLVLAVCEINVILGMDKKMIARAIAHKYQHQLQDINNLNMVVPVDLAEKYLSKIVQLPLALPDSGNEERIQFLNKQLGEEFKESGENQTEERMQFLNQQMGEYFKESGDEEIEEINQLSGEDFMENDDEMDDSWQNLKGFRMSGTESLSQEGPESLPESQPSDMENPQENLPQSCPAIFSDDHPNDVENPHYSLPQKHAAKSGPENRPIISQILEYFGALRSAEPVTFLLLIFSRALRTTLRRWSYSAAPDITSSKLKSVPINSQLILPSYTDEERKAMIFLSTKVSDGPQLPREWKRFLTYHRLAWNILFRFKQVKQLPGWQKWKELVSIKGGTVNDEDPSLKIIVEHYVDRNVVDVERDKWELLIKTLDEYDVPKDSIQSFQKFRLHCEIGYLPPPPANDTEPMSNTSASESEGKAN
ncbi:hypothetical protein SUGI_0363580 [Cryptomeria japonica]|nr:hypothetical protein SUGI_0363580 [Cryptomeria japonica]